MIWKDMSLAPQDGTTVLVTDGSTVRMASQRIGMYAGPSRDGMPTNGHRFPSGATGWMPLPDPQNGYNI
jgi:hypothetical protein